MVLMVAAGFLVLNYVRSPATTPAMRGHQLAGEHGCFACHGPDGGRFYPMSAGSQFPLWDQQSMGMIIEKEEDIRSWILDGRPASDPSGAAPPSDTKVGARVSMPAYRGLIGGRELEDLIAYYRALTFRDPRIPREAREGREVAGRKGCFTCHGPAGRGGIQNPGSFKGYIPPFDGPDFDSLVRDNDELRSWILDGTIPRFRENPLARYFIERQVITMPAYEGHITASEVDSIVYYIRYLRR